MKKTKQVSGWLQVLQSQSASKVQAVPDDWWRLGRIAKELGVTERTASKVVATAIAHGKAEKCRFTINGTGGIQSVWHFRLKK